MNALSRLVVRGVDLVNRRGKSVGVRLVKLTGKRPYAIHPKHLVDQSWHDWYIPYLSPTDRVLDVGTSNAAHLLQAAPHCQSIVGVDYDDAQLQIADRELRERRLDNARVFACDITRPLPFADRAFDTILFLDVIEHLVPRVAVLREIHRLLTDDGQLLVSAPNSQTRWRAHAAPGRPVRLLRSRPQDRVHARGVHGRAARGGLRGRGRADAGRARHPLGRRHRRAGRRLARGVRRLSRWKREAALRRPGDSTGFRARAAKAPR